MRDAPVARQGRRLASSVVVVDTDCQEVWASVGDNFLNIAINSVGPVMFHIGKVTIVLFLSPLPS